MGYPERKDERTGVAEKHRQAALGKGKGKKAKWVDWRSKDRQMLYKITTGYNPFQIEVNEKWYELKGIAFYDSKGVVIQTHGWFGSNNWLEEFPIPETIRRLKPKFDGETFIMPKKKEWHERSDPNPHAVLYIPIDYFNFEIKEREVDWGTGQKMKQRAYVSKAFAQDVDQTPVTLTEWIGEPYYTAKGKKIVDEIAKMEAELETKRKELSRT